MTPEEFHQMFPEMPKFLEIRKKLDPNGMFLNEFLERHILGTKSMQIWDAFKVDVFMITLQFTGESCFNLFRSFLFYILSLCKILFFRKIIILNLLLVIKLIFIITLSRTVNVYACFHEKNGTQNLRFFLVISHLRHSQIIVTHVMASKQFLKTRFEEILDLKIPKRPHLRGHI